MSDSYKTYTAIVWQRINVNRYTRYIYIYILRYHYYCNVLRDIVYRILVYISLLVFTYCVFFKQTMLCSDMKLNKCFPIFQPYWFFGENKLQCPVFIYTWNTAVSSEITRIEFCTIIISNPKMYLVPIWLVRKFVENNKRQNNTFANVCTNDERETLENF